MLKAVIIDYEESGRTSLQKMLEKNCPQVTVAGTASDVSEGFQLIKAHHPGLVFMDIELPNGSGFDLLSRFNPVDFRIIFVTAQPHYAIRAIRCRAADYLLKPVDIDELISAVNSVGADSTGFSQADHARPCKIAVPVKDGVVYITPNDIIRLQADGTYTHIFTSADKFTSSRNIKEYEQMLRNIHFFRSHHSHLINLNHVRRFSRADGFFVEMTDGSMAEIARRRKEEFMDMMTHLEV